MTTILAPPLLHSALALLSAMIGLMLSATFYKAAPRAQQQQQPEAPSNAPQVPPKRKLAALYPFASARRPRPIPNFLLGNTQSPSHASTHGAPRARTSPSSTRSCARACAPSSTSRSQASCFRTTPSFFERAALLAIAPTEIEYHRFAIPDRGLPADPALLPAVLAALRDSTARGRIAAVHCRGGIGRTGTVVGCWLVECGAARDGRAALAMIAREWAGVEKCTRYPHSPETGRAGRLRRKLPRAAAPAACAACVRDCVAAAAASAAVVVVGVAAECSTAVVAGGPSAGLAPGACLAPSHPPARILIAIAGLMIAPGPAR